MHPIAQRSDLLDPVSELVNQAQTAYMAVVTLSTNNSGETYSAVPTNE